MICVYFFEGILKWEVQVTIRYPKFNKNPQRRRYKILKLIFIPASGFLYFILTACTWINTGRDAPIPSVFAYFPFEQRGTITFTIYNSNKSPFEFLVNRYHNAIPLSGRCFIHPVDNIFRHIYFELSFIAMQL